MGHDLSDAAVTGDVKAPEIQSPLPQLDEYNNRQEDNKKIHKKGGLFPKLEITTSLVRQRREE